ncbi:MAG TPA: tetratricopeptide repeat protein [Blastocatellia bacterium]|nr:tetratricopeptide repeat protein [Blastocatellia bacterium]
MSEKRFRIAFSFAGEKRDFVAEVAAILAVRFGEDAILYDKFHEAEFARHDLGIYLPKLYGQQSDLIVPVLCPNYDQKRWTGWEWLHIYGLLTKADGKRVMPCRFEYAQADGLSPASGFIELDDKTPEQAANLILERLAINDNLPRDHYKASAKGSKRAAIPDNNLPRLPFFFGREAELKKVADSLAEDARGWGTLIDGPGGIGKTSLAIRAAELVPAGRFSRIIFLSSKERELTADGQRSLGNFILPSYLEMLNAIARELGKSEITKTIEEERAEAVLRALRGTDVLLLLDNLETLSEPDRDQLFAFLNRLPRGCSAIVTSRRRSDASAVIVRLDKLDWSAASELIAELAQNYDLLRRATEAERRELYENTGGNPLLIRWIAGQLGLGRCRTIASALEFLRSAPAGNNPLEFIFGDLLDTFSPSETKVLAALSYFTSPMAVKFIAELASLNEAAAQGALSDLSSRALVLADSEERNFILTPMIADYLRTKCPEVVAETGNRLEQYAYALIVENGYQKHDRFPALDTAWPTVSPALPLFIAGENQRLQTVCNALHFFFEFTGRWDEWLSLEQQAEAKAVAAGDYSNAGWRAYMMGNVHFLRQQADEVLVYAEWAAAHWQIAKAGVRERSTAIQLRGLGHQLKKNYPAAIAAYRDVLALYRSLSAESADVARTLNALADTERLSVDYAAAERDYREALRVARSVGYAEGEATFTGNLAALALDRKDWPRAETLARQALPLSEKVGRLELIALDCRRIAKALVRQGKSAEALPYAQRSVEIYERLGSPGLEEARATLAECEA